MDEIERNMRPDPKKTAQNKPAPKKPEKKDEVSLPALQRSPSTCD